MTKILETMDLIDSLLHPKISGTNLGTTSGVTLGTALATSDSPLNLDDVRVDPKWSSKVPAAIAIRRKLLPLCAVNERVVVATNFALDPTIERSLTKFFGATFTTVSAEPESLQRAITRIYGTLATSFNAEKQRRLDRDPNNEDHSNRSISLCDEMIQAAVLQNASDIHLLPLETSLKIQFRIDGVLETYRDTSIEAQHGLINRLKVMADLDIAEKRFPQDGSFTCHVGRSVPKIDVRIATLPTRFGERVTLRLLGSGRNLTISGLGMQRDDQKAFESALARPHGLVLLTGPTGSGKSTTLYAAISELLRSKRGNIITVEDPIEYEMPGVSQVEVDSSDKIGFSKALRSLLRHDPDVIMIGEIRDAETANVAMKASLTGHLVLSTLHTNTAVGVVNRLVDMGVERFMVAATLQLAVAQRLVRKLCTHCRKPRTLSATEYEAFRGDDLTDELTNNLPGATVYDAAGCVYCAGRGYAGRIALFEMMSCNEQLSAEIARGVVEHQLWASSQSMRTSSLANDAIAKLLAGETTVREVLSAVDRWAQP